MRSAYESIKRGLEEALAHLRGEDNGCVIHTPEEIRARIARREMIANDKAAEAITRKNGVKADPACKNSR